MGACCSTADDKVAAVGAGGDRPGPAPASPVKAKAKAGDANGHANGHAGNGAAKNGDAMNDAPAVLVIRDPEVAPQPLGGAATAKAPEQKTADAAPAPAPAPARPSTASRVKANAKYKGGTGSNGKRNVTFAILGLNNAGKTTIGNNIKGSPSDYVFPTMGFDLDEDITHLNFNVKLFGLGGGDSIRGYWANYYDDLHGVIFVIDSADTTRFATAKAVFKAMCADGRVTGKPVLIFANKQDLPGALSDVEIAKHIDLAELQSSPHHITKCVALVEPEKEDETDAEKAARKPPDANIVKGLHWLLSAVDSAFPELNERVERDLAARKIANAKQAEEKRRQVEVWRREEEAKAAAIAAAPAVAPSTASATVAVSATHDTAAATSTAAPAAAAATDASASASVARPDVSTLVVGSAPSTAVPPPPSPGAAGSALPNAVI